MAVAHADMILELQENLDSKEMPPAWMWPLHWEMEAHMAKVRSDRAAKYGTDDDDIPTDDVNGWESNELAEAWK